MLCFFSPKAERYSAGHVNSAEALIEMSVINADSLLTL